MRLPTGVACLAALIVVLLAGCARPESAWPDLGEETGASLSALLAGRDAEGRWSPGLLPYVAEAAAAAGKDLRAWPEPVPVADQVQWPADDAALLQALRPLHAAALAWHDDPTALDRVRQRVLAGYDGVQFGEPALLNDDAFALIVLGAAELTWSEELQPAIDGLVANQSADGGWSWSVGGTGETDVTGIVLEGLVHADAVGSVDREAVLDFLGMTAVDGGGHALAAGGGPNCDSTVWAIRSYDALGMGAPPGDWEFLLGLQLEDGSFAYTPGGPANSLCTAEAATLLALAQSDQVVVPRP
ncbi:MAG: hypothetical protein ACYC2H_07510 [Thermoplasmatota archaeon]